MRIVTWNVNSVRARLDRVVAWLDRHRPDVLCMQETKVVDEAFPREQIEALGYRLEVYGQKTYNGVAIASLHEMEDLVRGFPGDDESDAKRVIGATVGGIRVLNLYVPNGKAPDTEPFALKLHWLSRLRAFLDSDYDPNGDLVVLGDMNIAPEDRDVYDPVRLYETIHCTKVEREALGKVKGFGLADAFRLHHEEKGLYSWWDYRAAMFRRGLGMRIDLVLVTPSLAQRCVDVTIDVEERRGEKPSDHAPVIAEFE
jgi:exodeoxyribonuclease-3